MNESKILEPLLREIDNGMRSLENMLYTMPSVVEYVRSALPEEALQAVFSDEQKEKIAKGALKLMTKKDGSMMANLIDTKTKKIVSTVPLETISITPDAAQALANLTTQIQLAQIAEQIQHIQIAVEEVRKGQEYDRLATAYSCQQKLLQAVLIQDPKLKTMAMLGIASDAEDSRNLLMQSQSANVAFIKNQPEQTWKKLIMGSSVEKIDSRMNEIREGLYALNMVSFVEAMAYWELKEMGAAQQSLNYYAEYLRKTYLEPVGLIERLDSIDPSPENYWTKNLPEIDKKIRALPLNKTIDQIGE